MRISKLWLTHTRQGREMMNEHEDLKHKLYNRDLYLSYVQEKAPDLFAEMQRNFVGLQGCAVVK